MEPIKLQISRDFTRTVESLKFFILIGSYCPIVSAKKVQKSYLS